MSGDSIEVAWRMSEDDLVDVLLQHRPRCSGRHGNPPKGHADRTDQNCGPLYCPPCSEAEQEWVTWTPKHLAEAILAAAMCSHPSSTGVDMAPIGDPSKVWECHQCGRRWTDGDR